MTSAAHVSFEPEEVITFDYFKSLVADATKVYLDNKVRHEDGSVAKLEELLAVMPEVKNLTYVCNNEAVDGETGHQMFLLDNLKKLERFHISNIPSSLNCDDLFFFICKHPGVLQQYQFKLAFDNELRRSQLDQLVEVVISHSNVTAIIYYDGQDWLKRQFMEHGSQFTA